MKTEFSSLVTKSLVLSIATTPLNNQKDICQPLANLFPLLEGTEIFPQQGEQLIQLHNEIRFQIEEILTPIQLHQFAASLEEGGNFKDAVCVMNLSSQEWTQLRQVFQSSCLKLAVLFTSEQEKQILQSLQNRYKNKRIRNEEIVKRLTSLLSIPQQPSTDSGIG
ncbi:MAG: hypothetical protein KME32_33370 [Mojavia pulchra JT2-VF2]|jgi:hypothetical protein|uniref:Uncharacterized protein n=1 Tax=Mojavia pulchra JT2-VF2 TaxID=287848 RepID=A0A951Q848_9NOST|nr:hypothetical protein [Mojavia pulchra JT2-VF2]